MSDFVETDVGISCIKFVLHCIVSFWVVGFQAPMPKSYG